MTRTAEELNGVKGRYRTWSDGKQWDGFQPQAYSLDMERVCSLVLEGTVTDADGCERTISNIGDVLQAFRDEGVPKMDRGVGYAKVASNAHKASVRGPQFYLDVLGIVFDLNKDDIAPFEAVWYWYDSDSVCDDPHKIYRFFIVKEGKIVRERISLSDYSKNGFDPSVLVSRDYTNQVWFDEASWDAAWDRYCYRKFYSETMTGQLMVLRPDKPLLYYYQSECADSVGRGIERFTALKTYRLMWIVAALLAAIVFPSIKPYMAALAAIMAFNVLFIWWQSRKLGT